MTKKAGLYLQIAAMPVLCGWLTSPANAADRQLAIVAGTYAITVAGITETVDSKDLVPGGQPAGSNFTFHASPLGAGFILVHSTVAGAEPMILKIAFAPPPSSFTAGTLVSPDEIGFVELIFTGIPTDMSPGGSIISGGIIGDGGATYTTSAGDTFLDVYSHLLSLLTMQGVDAFQSGNDLGILSNEPDPASLAGAISFTSNDPVLSFDVQVGSVIPEPGSLSLVVLGVVGILASARFGSILKKNL